MLSISLGINILNYFLDVNNYIFALQDNLLTEKIFEIKFFYWQNREILYEIVSLY